MLVGAAFGSILGSDQQEPKGGFTCARAWQMRESLPMETDDKGSASEIPRGRRCAAHA